MKYANCKWCRGNGCLYCASERKKDEEKYVIKPIFSADLNNEKDIDLLKQFFGVDAINKAWDESDGAFNQREDFARRMALNGAIASIVQHVQKQKDANTGD